jgi:5-oxopent-3-ene-1,2,5-tricarboxylate decarboxylase/2-hydroxyhepta-2,4-diene-1,7-dioate isomerase
MKHARVAYDGAIHDATERAGQLLLADGRLVDVDAVVWLPPLLPVPWPRTVLALGLNYADHAKELAFKAPEEPLVFIKGEGSLIGHRAHTLRPTGVDYMHYECELAVVIGRTARKVRRENAYDFIAGYTVANDYAIRDYLENWYRPNLRVKNRDTCTPLGPWLVDAADIPNPMNLALQTTVNGRVTQSGHTRDMIFDVPFLIEYFSSFMTLHPGDLILTGTPDGVVDCRPGDVVVTEIEGLGALINTIAAPALTPARALREREKAAP